MTDKLIERARRLYRALEMSANIMRDPTRTGGWDGAEKTADAFERQAIAAKELHDLLAALDRPAPVEMGEVTQADREAAWAYIDRYLDGELQAVDHAALTLAMRDHRLAHSAPKDAGVAKITDAMVREAMQTAWDDFCDDAQAHPGDMRREGRKLWFTAGTWADHTAMHLRAMLYNFPSPPVPSKDEEGGA